MSKKITDTMICPECGHKQKAQIWPVVNSIENPRIKKKILDGTFFEHQCRECGESYVVTYDALYEDDVNRYILYHTSNDIMSVTTAQQAIAKRREIIGDKDDYRIRIVTSPSALREKVQVFDMNHDDRIIEIMKIALLEEMNKKNFNGHVDEVVCWIEDNGNFVVDFFGEHIGSIRVKKEFYHHIEEKCKHFLNKQNNNPTEVGLDFAIDFLDRNHFIIN